MKTKKVLRNKTVAFSKMSLPFFIQAFLNKYSLGMGNWYRSKENPQFAIPFNVNMANKKWPLVEV